MERMFDEHSFQEEITKPSEAKACYDYFVSNLTAFRQSLAEEGLSYEEINEVVKTCWLNLAKSCARVGWTNPHINRMVQLYTQKEK